MLRAFLRIALLALALLFGLLAPTAAQAAAHVITVTGTFLRQDGVTARVGKVNFVLSATLRDSVTGKSYTAGGIPVVIDGTGHISLPLVANDDPEVSPTGSTYEVTEVADGKTDTYSVVIPYNAAGGTVDLAALVKSDPQVVYGSSAAQLAAISARMVTTAVGDWYVDPALGSDSNPSCASSAPCKTVTEVLSNRLPLTVRHTQTIHLVAGNYNEALTIGPDIQDKTAQVLIQGPAMVAATGLSGSCPTTGTLGTPTTSNARELAPRFLPITSGTPNCTVNEMVGLLLRVGANTYPISGNTATMIELPSGAEATAAQSQAFTVIQPGAVWAPSSNPGIVVTGGRAFTRKGIPSFGGVAFDSIEFQTPTGGGYGVHVIGGSAGVRFSNCRFNYAGSATAMIRIDSGGSVAVASSTMKGNAGITALVIVRNSSVSEFDDVVFTSGQIAIWFESTISAYMNTTNTMGVVMQNSTSAAVTHGGALIFQGPGWYQLSGAIILRNNAEHGLNVEGPAAINIGQADGSPPAFFESYLNHDDGVHFTSAGAAFSGGGSIRFPPSVYIGENGRDGISFTSPNNRVTSYAGTDGIVIKNNTGFGIAMHRGNWIAGSGFLAGSAFTDAFGNYVGLPITGTSLAGNTAGGITYDNGTTVKTYAQYKVDHPNGVFVDGFGNSFLFP